MSPTTGPVRPLVTGGHAREPFDDDAPRRREAILRREAAELRLRTAMELHDGILQTLTAAGLQIELARRLVGRDPAAAEAVLRSLGETVAAEQREIRLYVDEVRGAAALTDGALDLAERIGSLTRRVGRIWGLKTSVDVRGTQTVAPEPGRRILRIIQEATVNAARHGAARSIAVAVDRDGDHLAVTVSDDGHGFPFTGEYDHEALKRERLGPVSLKHRVEGAGGRIHIDSGPGGATVSVRIPLPARAP